MPGSTHSVRCRRKAIVSGGAAPASPTLDAPYEDYRRIVRGYDRRHGGFQETPHTITLDAGCGFGGPLIAGCFGPSGAFEGTLAS